EALVGEGRQLARAAPEVDDPAAGHRLEKGQEVVEGLRPLVGEAVVLVGVPRIRHGDIATPPRCWAGSFERRMAAATSRPVPRPRATVTQRRANPVGNEPGSCDRVSDARALKPGITLTTAPQKQAALSPPSR